MSRCDDLMPPLQEALAWQCETLPDGTLLVTTDRCFADGDTISLLVQHGTGGHLAVSDGGLVTSRLELHGIQWRGTTRSSRAWEEILRAYGVEEMNGRIYLRGDTDHAPSLLSQVADAALALDSLIHAFAPGQESRTFVDQVTQWLRDEITGAEIEQQVPIRDRQTPDTHQFTAKVTTGTRSVLVKAVGGRASDTARASALRASFDFSRISPDDWPPQTRLAIVNDPSQLTAGHLAHLQAFCYVGDWNRQIRMDRFIRGDDIPDSHDLTSGPDRGMF